MLQGSVATLKFIKRIQIHLGRTANPPAKVHWKQTQKQSPKTFFLISPPAGVCAIQYSTILVTEEVQIIFACLTFSGLLHIIACGHYSYELQQL